MTQTPLERVLAAFPAAREVGPGSWKVKCPTHEDSTASLSIDSGNDGRALVLCRAGCTTADVLGAVGLSLADLMPKEEKPAHASAPRRKGTVVATYLYKDEAGEVLYRVERDNLKQFWPARPADGGKWVNGLLGARRVPYKFPELIDAVTAEETIYIVEGEKDADNLVHIGLYATTHAGGTGGKGQWEKFAPLLKGVHQSVYLPDNDDPGRKCAAYVAQELKKAGVPVKVLELSGLPVKGDVSDWIDGGGTAEELQALAEAAPFWSENTSATGAPETAADEESTPTVAEWPTITPLGEFNLPTFPVETLPLWVADHAAALSHATQTPIDLPAMISLSALASCLQKKAEAVIGPGWIEPINIYTTVVLGPGTRKSAVCSAVTRPLEEFEREERDRLRPEIAAKQSELRILNLKLKEFESRAGRNADEDQSDQYRLEAARLAKQIANSPDPSEFRIFVEDTTPEKLSGLLAENEGRMAVVSAEGDLFDVIVGRYSSTPNLGVFLKSHSGETLIVDRVGRKGERVEKPALSLGLAIQPDVIRGLMATKALRGRGLLARFLYSMPEDIVGYRDIDAKPVPTEISVSYRQGIHVLLAIPPRLDDWGKPIPHALGLSSRARAAMRDYQIEIEMALRPEGEMGDIKDWGGKLAGAVARIAALLHIADHALPATPWELTPISEDVMRRAIAIGHYLKEHAHAAFAEMGADAELDNANHILEWIKREERDGFKAADLYQMMRRRFKRHDDMLPALSILEERGYIRFAPPTTEEKRHNAKGHYDINPATYNCLPFQSFSTNSTHTNFANQIQIEYSVNFSDSQPREKVYKTYDSSETAESGNEEWEEGAIL